MRWGSWRAGVRAGRGSVKGTLEVRCEGEGEGRWQV